MQAQNYKTTQLPSIESIVHNNFVTSVDEFPKERQFHSSLEENSLAQRTFLQALRYTETKELEKAAESYKSLAGLLPQDSTLLWKGYILVGTSYLELQKYVDAVTYYKKAIKLYPENDMAHRHLGVVYLRQGKFMRALQSLREAIKINPKEVWSHLLLGFLYHQQQQWDLAIRHYEKSISIKKDFEMPYAYLAGLYLDIGLVKYTDREKFLLKAISVYQSALRVSRKKTEIYNDIGVVHSLLGNDKKALEAFQKAIELDPTNTDAQSNLFELKNAMVKERLLKKGSIERIPELITDFTPYKKRKLFQVKGKPLSQTIIEERR